MSADTTPVILITNGERGGREYRVAVAQAWELAWNLDGEEEVLDSRYVVDVFRHSPVISTTIDDARQALATYIETTGWAIQYDEQVLDLSVSRPRTDLERHLGITRTFTFRDLEEQAKQPEVLDASPRSA